MEAETVENKLNISLINLGRWKIYGIERKSGGGRKIQVLKWKKIY
jgi:hypothetical protein